MAELTLEMLAKRIETLERLMKIIRTDATDPTKDFRRSVGMFTGSDFMKRVDAEGTAIRERDREETREDEVE